MKVGIPKMTIEEWSRLPDDGNRYELIDGQLLVSPSPRPKHQRVLGNLLDFLRPYVKSRNLGAVYFAPFDVFLDPGSPTCVEPDILFIAANRLHLIDEKKGMIGAPELVVEIFSESTWRVDMREKKDLYRRTGVQEYWMADPDDRTLAVCRFAESDQPRTLAVADTLTSPLFPGLEIPLRSIFDY
jgi:Uma2 family endonuclease